MLVAKHPFLKILKKKKKRPVLNFFSKFPSDQLFLPCHLLRLPHLLMFPLLSVNISSRISCPQLLKQSVPTLCLPALFSGYCDTDYPFPLKTSKISTLPFVLSLDTNKIKFPISSKIFQSVLWTVVSNTDFDFRKYVLSVFSFKSKISEYNN